MKKRLLLFLITLLPMFANAGDFNGHNYVDLGLPSGKCWATTNYGANTPEGYGTYMDWSNNSAIASQWGAEWTTPSLDDILELENNCTWTWENYNGINGYKVIGNNGNSIFLPASGYKMMGQSSAKKVGEWAYYWTLTPANGMAYIIMGTLAEVAYGQMNTSMTYLPIRPVTKESQSSQENNSNFDGEGTKNSPYQIKTSSDLTTLANLVNSGNSYSSIYFGLSDNIDMTETNFIPIGNQAHPFSGIFDGNGYVIKGITINSSSEIGLFGCTDGATINDIGIEDADLNSSSYIGGVVGYSNNTLITNCYTRGYIRGDYCDGAIVGYSGSGTVIQNCFSSIQHTKAQIYGQIGGLVGYNCGTLENSYFYGTINATSFQAWTTGGIVGYNDTSGKVYNCYFIKASILNSSFDYCGSLNWGQCSGLATFDGSGTTNYGTYLPNLLNNWVVEHRNQGYYRKWSSEGFPSFIEYAEHEEQKEVSEYVDLGLPSGLLWATKNVGANRPEESGYYFAWGETSPKNEYSWATYKYANGSEMSLTKYCNTPNYGNVDYKETLDPEDDAATVNLGKSWRTPTLLEIQELREYCEWSRTTLNGVSGCKAIGPNGNSIFIPSCGVKQYGGCYYVERSCVMSSTYYCTDNSNASVLCCIDPTPEYWYVWGRAWGYNVRPVVNTSSTRIEQTSVDNAEEIVGIYDTHGLKQNGFHKGINIVKYKDGTTKKVIKQ